MAYKIRYGPVKCRKKKITASRLVLAAFVLIALLLVGVQQSVSVETITDLLIPGDPQVTLEAMENFAQNLKDGQTVGDAFTCFCREIIDAADLPQ